MGLVGLGYRPQGLLPLSWSSTDDLNDVNTRGDIWEVRLPFLQLLGQTDER